MRQIMTTYGQRVPAVLLSLGLGACSSSEPEESRLEKACRADYVAQSRCGPFEEADEAEFVSDCQESEPEVVTLLECRAMELEKDCDVDRVGEVCYNEDD